MAPKSLFFANVIAKEITDLFVQKIDAATLPPRGPAILVANHSSLLDGVILVSQLSILRIQPVHWIAYEEPFRHWLWGWFLRSSRCIPFHRGEGPSRERMMRLALGYLAMGEFVGIFPEGHINDGKNLRRPRQGAALLALESGVPVVPIGIRFSWETLPLGVRWPRWGRRIEVCCGSPLSFSDEHLRYHRSSAAERHHLIADVLGRIMDAIAALSGLRRR